jgi:hypothetical protein
MPRASVCYRCTAVVHTACGGKLLTVGDHREAEVAPHPLLRRLIRILHLDLKVGAIIAIKVATEGAFSDFARHVLPRQSDFDLLA